MPEKRLCDYLKICATIRVRRRQIKFFKMRRNPPSGFHGPELREPQQAELSNFRAKRGKAFLRPHIPAK
jgi:hypothetical protein